MLTLFRAVLASAAIGLSALAAPASAQVAYSIADGGTSLFRVDSGGNLSTVDLSGAVESLGGIALRPFNDTLYGVGLGGEIVTLNPFTGVTTLASTSSFAPAASSSFSISFNPAADRLRLVTDSGQNLRINVDTGVAIADTPLTYAAGDVNAGATPSIVAIAYTNRDDDPATGTQLFYIDDQLDILATTASPNGGVLSTVGELLLDVNGLTGFDILSDATGSLGILLSDFGLVSAAGILDLDTGAAVPLLPLPAGLRGLVVDLDTTAFFVPEPGSLALMLAGLGAVGWTRRHGVVPVSRTAA